MTTTYTYINKVQLSSPASSATFTSIPATFKDLVIRYNVRSDNGGFNNSQFRIRFNGDTSSNYWYVFARATGGDAPINSATNDDSMYGGLVVTDVVSSGFFSTGEIYVCDYTSLGNKTVTIDTVSSREADPSYMTHSANLYVTTDAISSIQLFCPSNNLVANSTFYLYGISNS